MDNIKKALLQLTHNAEIEISKLKLPFEFLKIGFNQRLENFLEIFPIMYIIILRMKIMKLKR